MKLQMLVVLAMAPLYGCHSAAYYSGKEAARNDISRGVYTYEMFGLLPDCESEYCEILKSKYGIEMRRVGSCAVPDDAICDSMDGYNLISIQEIKRKFGSDVFDRTWKEASILHEQRRNR